MATIRHAFAGLATAFLCAAVMAAVATFPTRAFAGGAGLNAGKDCPPCGPENSGDPISVSGGNVFEEVSDYKSNNLAGNMLEVTRYYNSNTGVPNGSFGKWSWTYDRFMSIGTSEIDVSRPDGKVVYFFKNQQGAWVGPTDLSVTLVPSGQNWVVTDEDDTVDTYDANGRMLSTRKRNGYTQTLTYTSQVATQPNTITDSYGRTLTIAYASGRVSSITRPDGLVMSYTYNQQVSSALTSVTYPTSPPSTVTYLYDTSNQSSPSRLTGIVDENGNRAATFTYDPSYPYPRALSSQKANGIDLTTLSYGTGSNPIANTLTNALGQQEVHKFSTILIEAGGIYLPVVTEIDRLASSTTAAATKRFTYDTNGYLASQTDWNGNKTVYVNDVRGNETSRTVAFGTPQAATTTTTWHPTLHLPTQIVQQSRVSNYTYDANGNLLTEAISSPTASSTRSFTYNTTGQVLTATDVRGATTTYTYDAQGNLATATNPLGQVTSYTSFDANGRLLSMRDPNGLVTTTTYNARGQLTSTTQHAAFDITTTYTYDLAQQLVSTIRPDGATYTFTYDAAHRLTGVTDPLGGRIVFTLDAAGNKTLEQTFGAGNNVRQTRSFTYDALGRVIQTTGAQGQATTTVYDSNGNIVQVMDAVGKSASYTYDPINRVIQSTDPRGVQTSYAYDLKNRMTSTVDPRGLTTLYGYDGLDNLVSIQSLDTGTTTSSYDPAGNLVAVTDARGNTTTYTYDALNRLTKATLANGNVTTYSYDQGVNGIGRLTTMADPAATTTWVYNLIGQIRAKTQDSANVMLTTQVPHDQYGRASGLILPSGASLAYVFDGNGQVSGITFKPASSATTSPLLAGISYRPFSSTIGWSMGNGAAYTRSFDLDGRITGIAMGANASIGLTYDADSRIASMSETGLPAKNFAYSAVGRLNQFTNGPNANVYTYDDSGNRTGATTTIGGVATSATYQYASNSNRLMSIAGPAGTESFTYDAFGNTVTDTTPSSQTTFAYTVRNRMRSSTGASTVNYAFNGLGQRITKSTVTYMYDDAGHILGKYDGTGGAQETVWLGNMPVAVIDNGATASSYIAPDQLDAPHQITNGANQVVWLWDHDPFGNGTPTGGYDYQLRFPGQFYDGATGLHQNGFRDYSPKLGRYIESDPKGLAGGPNTYAYLGGDPVNGSDPFGLKGGTVNVTVPGFDASVTAGREGVQLSGGFVFPGGVGATAGPGTFSPPTPPGGVNGDSDITVRLPFIKICYKIEKNKLTAKVDGKVGLGISGGTSQTATGPVVPWSQITPQGSPLQQILSNPNSAGPLAPFLSGYK